VPLVSGDGDPAKWLEARRQLITASEVPAVLGLVPGAPRLWYEKRGMLEREDLSAIEAVQMGHDLEPVNAQLFARKTQRRVQRSQMLYRSREYPWLGATLDYAQWDAALHGDDAGVLECKSTGNKDNWPEDGEPATHYQAQLQTQLLVVGASWGSLSAIIGSPTMHHRHLDYEKHDGFCELVLDKTYAFWKSIEDGNPPVDGSWDTNDALRHLTLGTLAGTTTQLRTEAIEWAEMWLEAKKLIAETEKQKLYFENLLMTAIGLHDTAVLPDGRGFTFKEQRRKGYTVEESWYRVLRFKDKF
jgi:putative phage-type endonuclease